MPPDAGTSAPSDKELAAVQELYDRGLYLDALKRVEGLTPLAAWSGPHAGTLGSRLAAILGAARLAYRLERRAWRETPQDARVRLGHGLRLLERRGPLLTLLSLRTWPAPTAAADAPSRGALLALEARLAAELRDFGLAEKLQAEAETLAPDDAWVRLQRANALHGEDRVEEALEVARAALDRHPHPHYRPAVQTIAHLLQSLNRDEEALAALAAADRATQSAPVAFQRFTLLTQMHRWEEAAEALERYAVLSPLLEPPGPDWIAAQRAHLAWRRGERALAARWAGTLDDPFHREFAARLAGPAAEGELVGLPVPFVRQHFKTCAPATLAALGRHWGMPTRHLELVEAVCYDGTPPHAQRDWAGRHGWHVREFRLTWESGVALLSRGVPFAVSVAEATSAHMMAVVGFDRVRATFILRDPSQPYAVEAQAGPFLERYRPFGPRATVFVPAAEQPRLAGLELPDEAPHDTVHEVALALSRHDRPAAAAALAGLEAAWPDHPLAWGARLEIAAYDGDSNEEARCLDRLLELFPGTAARQLRRLGALRDAPREERLRFLTAAGQGRRAAPALRLELAGVLLDDARQHAAAERLLIRAFRARPMDANAMRILGNLRWMQCRLQEATELYRFAANTEGFREELYQTWFAACRRTRRTAAALAHLEDRVRRLGRRSEQPALTLAWAWQQLEQPARARAVLAEALQVQPENGLLQLRTAGLAADEAEARRMLDSARGRVREADWLRAAAELAERRFDAAALLEHSRALLALEPLALDAHHGAARALARLEGLEAALNHLRAACDRFPHHHGLRRTLVEWSREAGVAAHEAAVRGLLALSPSDAWAHRELALALLSQNQPEAARAAAGEALAIEPLNAASHGILGQVEARLGRPAQAREHLRRAITLDVDDQAPIGTLLTLAATDEERRRELAFIERQLVDQVVRGDGLLAYLDFARPILDPAALLQLLRDAHAARPDLWHVWSALVSQLGHLGQYEEALALARQATDRFPHLPRVWLDLAEASRWINRPDEELAAAQRAFEIGPAWLATVRALADVHERAGRLEDSLQVFGRALVHLPAEARLHAWQAGVRWRLGRQEEALAGLEQALRLAPELTWAWELHCGHARQAGQAGRPAGFARGLAAERPGDGRVWLLLARCGEELVPLPERLRAVEKAVAASPGWLEARDLQVCLLVEAERFDDAVAAGRTALDQLPVEGYLLRGRLAWVEAARGRLDAAVAQMRAVLAENSSYVWGWTELAGWLVTRDDLAEAEAAIGQLRRLEPHRAAVLGQLGLVRRYQGNTAGAREAFAAAVRLDPTDGRIAQHWFELCLETGDMAGAGAAVRVQQLHHPGAGALANEIKLLLRHGDHAAACDALRRLCRQPFPDFRPLAVAADAFVSVGQARLALRELRALENQPGVNPLAGVAAIRLLLQLKRPWAATRWFLRLRDPAAQDQAAVQLLPNLIRLGRGRTARLVLWRRREVFRRTDEAWGEAGGTLLGLPDTGRAARWLADWRQRRGAQPWMLFNLCVALRDQGRLAEADEVARHVMQDWGHRPGAQDLRLFLAVEDALAGETESAAEHLRHTVVREGSLYDRRLKAAADALVRLQRTPRAERATRFAEIRTAAGPDFVPGFGWGDLRDPRRTFRRAGRYFVRHGAGCRARLWFAWQLHRYWLLAALVVAAGVGIGALSATPLILPALLAFLLSRRLAKR